MGKGGSNEIQETEAQKAAASVAMEQWDLYKNDLQKYEDIFIEELWDVSFLDPTTGEEIDVRVEGRPLGVSSWSIVPTASLVPLLDLSAGGGSDGG